MFSDPLPRRDPPPPDALAAWQASEIEEAPHDPVPPTARLATESEAAYRAFCHYLNSGLPDPKTGTIAGRRSKTATARWCGHSQPNTVKKWARAFAWEARCQAEDDRLARLHAAKLGSAAEVLGDRHQRIATDLLALAEAEIERYRELADEGVGITGSLGELSKIVQLAQQIQRLQLGLSTSNSSVRDGTAGGASGAHADVFALFDLTKLELEEISALQYLLAKARSDQPLPAPAEDAPTFTQALPLLLETAPAEAPALLPGAVPARVELPDGQIQYNKPAPPGSGRPAGPVINTEGEAVEEEATPPRPKPQAPAPTDVGFGGLDIDSSKPDVRALLGWNTPRR